MYLIAICEGFKGPKGDLIAIYESGHDVHPKPPEGPHTIILIDLYTRITCALRAHLDSSHPRWEKEEEPRQCARKIPLISY